MATIDMIMMNPDLYTITVLVSTFPGLLFYAYTHYYNLFILSCSGS